MPDGDSKGLRRPLKRLFSKKSRNKASSDSVGPQTAAVVDGDLRSSAEASTSDRIPAGDPASSVAGGDPYESDLRYAQGNSADLAAPDKQTPTGRQPLGPVAAQPASHLSVMQPRSEAGSPSAARQPVLAQQPWELDAGYAPRLPRPVQPAELVSTPTQPQHYPVSPFSQVQPVPAQQQEQNEDLEQQHYKEADDALRRQRTGQQRQRQQQQQQQQQRAPQPQKPPAYPKPTMSSQGHGDSMQTRINSVSSLARNVVKAGSRKQKGEAVLKLYAVTSQAAFVTQRGLTDEWTAIYLGLLNVGLARFVKHCAGIVIRTDKGFTDLVRTMAASILKSMAEWIERELINVDQPDRQAAVITALEEILTDTHVPRPQQQLQSRRDSYASQSVPHAIPETEVAELRPEDSARDPNSILDTQALHGVLDLNGWSTPRAEGKTLTSASMTETGVLGSLLDTASLEAMMGQNGGPSFGGGYPRGPRGRMGILDTQLVTSQGSYIETQDLPSQMMEHKGALRAAFWLFRTDQPEGWSAAASLIGSIASLGLQEIEAINGFCLIRPLMWLLRCGDASGKSAAMRALMFLADEAQCRTVLARKDKYLRELARVLASGPADAQWSAATTIAIIVADDPSCHWVLTQASVIPSMIKILQNPTAPLGVKADITLALKYLTANSQRNRDGLLAASGLTHLIPLLQSGFTEAQYNTARILRHLALASPPSQKRQALLAIVPLVEALKVARPRVAFACAAALAMLTEGNPAVCADIDGHGGTLALVGLLSNGGGQGKKSAAEALQAMAAEDEQSKIRIVTAGAVKPLVAMVRDGNLQQQAAGAGALQALAYCPTRGSAHARAIAKHDAILPLVDMLHKGPIPMCCAAAGALCNLALASTDNQVDMIQLGTIPLLVRLLSGAQPDGQYSAAAGLYNLATCSAVDAHGMIISAGAIPSLIPMLGADSWYCRIVASEVLAVLLAGDPGRALEDDTMSALSPLMALLTLHHRPGMLDDAHSPVAHLAYERNEDVIVMKGYKFARAKIAAASALACMALASEEAATIISQNQKVLQRLMAMLQSGSSDACRTAAAAIADLAISSHAAFSALAQKFVLHELVSLLARSISQQAGTRRSIDQKPGTVGPRVAYSSDSLKGLANAVAAVDAMRAIEGMDSSDAVAHHLVSLGAVQHLMRLVSAGVQAGGISDAVSCAARLLQQLTAVPEAQRAVSEAGMDALLSEALDGYQGDDASEGLSPALLFQRLRHDYTGFAITAKPSANLYILLQVPFDTLMPLEASPPQDHPELRDIIGESPGEGAGGSVAEDQRQRVRSFLDRRAASGSHEQPPSQHSPPLSPATPGTEAGSPFVNGRPSQAHSRASARPAGPRGPEEGAGNPLRPSGDRASADASTVAARSSFEEHVPAAAGRRSPAMLPAAQRDILETWLEY